MYRCAKYERKNDSSLRDICKENKKRYSKPYKFKRRSPVRHEGRRWKLTSKPLKINLLAGSVVLLPLSRNSNIFFHIRKNNNPCIRSARPLFFFSLSSLEYSSIVILRGEVILIIFPRRTIKYPSTDCYTYALGGLARKNLSNYPLLIARFADIPRSPRGAFISYAGIPNANTSGGHINSWASFYHLKGAPWTFFARGPRQRSRESKKKRGRVGGSLSLSLFLSRRRREPSPGPRFLIILFVNDPGPLIGQRDDTNRSFFHTYVCAM